MSTRQDDRNQLRVQRSIEVGNTVLRRVWEYELGRIRIVAQRRFVVGHSRPSHVLERWFVGTKI